MTRTRAKQNDKNERRRIKQRHALTTHVYLTYVCRANMKDGFQHLGFSSSNMEHILPRPIHSFQFNNGSLHHDKVSYFIEVLFACYHQSIPSVAFSYNGDGVSTIFVIEDSINDFNLFSFSCPTIFKMK